MPKAQLILKRHARGEYEIGIQTEDGAVVARVSIWDGASIDQRSEGEREKAALEKAARLAHAFSAAVGWSMQSWSVPYRLDDASCGTGLTCWDPG